jgi:hypothetical protein
MKSTVNGLMAVLATEYGILTFIEDVIFRGRKRIAA